MTLGTKTLLFGVHQIIIHPLFVLYAWIKLYKSFPGFKELVCIFIHDWGYWGKPSIKCADGDTHPEFGAKIASFLFGSQWGDFILGHSTKYIKKYNVKSSKLMPPDKYWHCLVPLWIYKCLSIPTGELNHYMETWKNHYKLDNDLSIEEWWNHIQQVALDKIKNKENI